MPLDFYDDAIILSGRTGTKIKTEVLGQYYDYWQRIVSGGPNQGYKHPAIIMDMNAGTGEIYLEDDDKVILGSAGHALELKFGRGNEDRSKNLRIVLVEEHSECLQKLIRVINRRWPYIRLKKMGNNYISRDGMLRIYNSVDSQLFRQIWSFGNYLIFFDPLRAIMWDLIDRVAHERIRTPFQIRTEFLVFLFTSDWILGRKDFCPLPRTQDTSEWNKEQHQSASEADAAFGDRGWLPMIADCKSDKEMKHKLVKYYQRKLRKWFRFVTPLPFKPKGDERFDLFCCSNYIDGGRLVRRFFRSMIERYNNKHPSLYEQPKATETYPLFQKNFPELFSSIKDKRIRPPEWKIFWQIVREHPNGICDQKCDNLLKQHPDNNEMALAKTLEWLRSKNLLRKIKIEFWPWSNYPQFPQFSPNWSFLQKRFGLRKPPDFEPLEPL